MYSLVLQGFIKIAIFGVFQSKIEFCDFEGQESQFKYDLPVLVFISYHTVFQCLLYLVHDGIGVCMGHDERIGTGALFHVFLHEWIVLGYLPLLIIQETVGLVVLLAL